MCPAPPTLKTFCHLNRVACQLSFRITEEKSFEGWPEYIKNLKTTLKQNAKSNCGKLKSVLLFMPASGEGGILTHKLPKLPNRFEHWDLESFKNPYTVIFRTWSVETSFLYFFAFNLVLATKNKKKNKLPLKLGIPRSKKIRGKRKSTHSICFSLKTWDSSGSLACNLNVCSLVKSNKH